MTNEKKPEEVAKLIYKYWIDIGESHSYALEKSQEVEGFIQFTLENPELPPSNYWK